MADWFWFFHHYFAPYAALQFSTPISVLNFAFIKLLFIKYLTSFNFINFIKQNDWK